MTRFAIAVAVFLCVSATFASLRESSASRNDQVFRGASDSVAIYATVTRDGKPARGLIQSDFELFDNGKTQPITVFSNATQPITIGLLLDRSGSMAKQAAAVTAAAAAFVDKLDGPDRASLSTLTWDCAPLTTDRRRLNGLLGEDVPMDLGSPIWDGLDRVMRSLAPEPGRRAVLMFSDGMNSGVPTVRPIPPGTLTPGGCTHAGAVSDATREEVGRRAQREGFLIYAIGVVHGVISVGDNELRTLARDSGGERYRLEREEELKGAFTQIADELHQQYLIGFVPAEFDGKVHDLEVRVKRPGYDVRARRRYVAVRDVSPTTAAAANAAVATPPAPIGDAEATAAIQQGLAGRKLEATCKTSPITEPGANPPSFVEATLEGPTGRIMRAARDAKQARTGLTLQDLPAELREPAVFLRATIKQGDKLELVGMDGPAGSRPVPIGTSTSRPVMFSGMSLDTLFTLLSVRLRSGGTDPELLAPTSSQRSARAMLIETRFDLAAVRAVQAAGIEVVATAGKTVGRCRISPKDAALVR